MVNNFTTTGCLININFKKAVENSNKKLTIDRDWFLTGYKGERGVKAHQKWARVQSAVRHVQKKHNWLFFCLWLAGNLASDFKSITLREKLGKTKQKTKNKT